jgi:hypothetical protein
LGTALYLLLERQEQARALRESEEKYRNVLTQLMHDKAGRPTGFRGIQRDITASKAPERLRKSA